MDLFDIVISGKINREGRGDITVEPLSVTQNGEYTADTGKAYSPVSVAVPQPSGNINITSTAQTDVSAYATAQVVDADLVAGNIKKDVDILGVVGTYEGGGGGGLQPLYTQSLGHVTGTDTEQALADQLAIPQSILNENDIIFVEIRRNTIPTSVSEDTHISSVCPALCTGRDGNSKTFNSDSDKIIKRKLSSGEIYVTQSIYAHGFRIGNTSSGSGTYNVQIKYKATSTSGVIDGDYTARVYGIKFPPALS